MGESSEKNSVNIDLDEFEDKEPETKLGRLIQTIEGYILSLLLFAILVLIIAQVYYRFFTESSIVWSEELSRFMLIWLVFIGTFVALRRGAHIQIDNLLEKAPPVIRTIMLIIRNVTMLIFLYVLFKGSLAALKVSAMQKSPGLGLNMKYVYGIFPVAMILMIITVMIGAIIDIKGGERK